MTVGLPESGMMHVTASNFGVEDSVPSDPVTVKLLSVPGLTEQVSVGAKVHESVPVAVPAVDPTAQPEQVHVTDVQATSSVQMPLMVMAVAEADQIGSCVGTVIVTDGEAGCVMLPRRGRSTCCACTDDANKQSDRLRMTERVIVPHAE